jgi:hypothetical protein
LKFVLSVDELSRSSHVRSSYAQSLHKVQQQSSIEPMHIYLVARTDLTRGREVTEELSLPQIALLAVVCSKVIEKGLLLTEIVFMATKY